MTIVRSLASLTHDMLLKRVLASVSEAISGPEIDCFVVPPRKDTP